MYPVSPTISTFVDEDTAAEIDEFADGDLSRSAALRELAESGLHHERPDTYRPLPDYLRRLMSFCITGAAALGVGVIWLHFPVRPLFWMLYLGIAGCVFGIGALIADWSGWSDTTPRSIHPALGLTPGDLLDHLRRTGR